MLNDLLEKTCPHHGLAQDGTSGAADVAACKTGIAVLNGARGGAAIPADDRAEVYRHLAEHIREAGCEPPPLTSHTEERPAERRTLSTASMGVTRSDAGAPVLVGYAAVFDQPTDAMAWYGFREVVRAGAFANSIIKDDVRALLNHDPNLILGRNKSGTLRLSEDDHGLRVEIDMPSTSYASDLLASMERGDLNQMSFGFRTVRDRWTTNAASDELDLRELLEVELFDVSPVTFPAYPQTTVAQKRDLQAMADSLRSIGTDEQPPEDGLAQREYMRLRLEVAQRAVTRTRRAGR